MSARQQPKPTDPSPLISYASDTGTRWGLDQHEFDRWWRALPIEDYEAFIFYGGDEVLMRFICAFDWLCHDDNRQTPGRLLEAYAVATGMDATSAETRLRAGRAWEHPATRDLIDRLQYRDLARAKTRVARQYVELLETMLSDADNAEIKDKAFVADAVSKYLKMQSVEEMETRKIRTRTLEKMHVALQSQHQHQDQTPKEEELPGFMKMLTKQFGTAKVLALVSTPETEEHP